MRKIKSVKTKLLYTAGFEIIPIGTEGWKEADLWRFTSNFSTVSYSEEWILKRESLFAIEYEPEGFEFSHFPFYANDSCNKQLIEKELNRLADWCDGQSEESSNTMYTGMYINENDELKKSSYMFTIYQGLKFNSQKSAELFTKELNKPENSDYKNYFIELLKKTRL